MSLKLVESVASGTVSLSSITKEDLIALIKASVTNGDFRALELITNSVTGIYNYDEHKPYWLKSDFQSPTWYIEIKSNNTLLKKIIDWDVVVLSNGSKLTCKENMPLLNAFKYWVTATDNPLENGGKILKQSTVSTAISQVITLINGFLIHGDSINLSSQHLSGLNEDFLMALLVKIGEGGVEYGVYDYHTRVREYLLKKTVLITDEDAIDFEDRYPFVTRTLVDDEKVLNLTVSERVKACCWLERIGYYQRRHNQKLKLRLSGNNSVLASHIYENKILPVNGNVFSTIEELKIDNLNKKTEYLPIPNRDVSNAFGEGTVNNYINILKLLNSVYGKRATSQFPIIATKHLSLPRVCGHVNLKSSGRFRTLPPKLVFGLIKDCYEFVHEYQDALLNSVYRVLKESTFKNDTKKTYVSGNKTIRYERYEWAKAKSIDFVEFDLIKLGVKKLYVMNSEEDVFIKRRNNIGLFDLYNVLIGSIQVLIGVIMAKRVDELINLREHGNLHPNIDPSSEKGQNIDYYLIAEVKKTGIGGKHGRNAINKRPIARSIALFVWRLERFNKLVIEVGVNKGKLSLFNNLRPGSFCLSRVNGTTYNNHMDAVCDYFQTSLVEFGNREKRRYYVRQHQLRRFFAMTFFWSKGFDGLESLRWMLGHSDVEHLYHYISESETGAVLNGIKASYIVSAVENNKLENIDALADKIAKRYGVAKANISLSTVTHAVEDYDGDYKTLPTIEKLQKQETLESQVLELLEDGSISLEPEFFTVKHKGKDIHDFTLTLQVNDID